MANEDRRVDLESQIRSFNPALRTMQHIERLSEGTKRLNSLMKGYEVDGLEELAKVSRLFGKKANDRGLIVYINFWILNFLKNFALSSLPSNSTVTDREILEKISMILQNLCRDCYSAPKIWMDRTLSEVIGVISQGTVEAAI